MFFSSSHNIDFATLQFPNQKNSYGRFFGGNLQRRKNLCCATFKNFFNGGNFPQSPFYSCRGQGKSRKKGGRVSPLGHSPPLPFFALLFGGKNRPLVDKTSDFSPQTPPARSCWIEIHFFFDFVIFLLRWFVRLVLLFAKQASKPPTKKDSSKKKFKSLEFLPFTWGQAPKPPKINSLVFLCRLAFEQVAGQEKTKRVD